MLRNKCPTLTAVLFWLLLCSFFFFFGGGGGGIGSVFKGESNALYSHVQTHLASCGFDSRRIISIYYCIVFSVDETLYKVTRNLLGIELVSFESKSVTFSLSLFVCLYVLHTFFSLSYTHLSKGAILQEQAFFFRKAFLGV